MRARASDATDTPFPSIFAHFVPHPHARYLRARPSRHGTQFEKLISTTIEETKDIPEIISETGKIDMSHKEIMRKIGELFLLRTNINSVGSVLDSPVRTPLTQPSEAPVSAPPRLSLTTMSRLTGSLLGKSPRDRLPTCLPACSPRNPKLDVPLAD